MIFILIFIFIVIVVLRKINKEYVILLFCRRFKTLNGEPLEKSVAIDHGHTIFGTTFEMMSLNAEQIFYHSRDLAQKMKRSYIEYIFCAPVYNIIDAADAELVLSHPDLITKGFAYSFLNPFLRTGLLISSGKKWHARRKMLTPAFHFNILERFMDIFKRESEKFTQNIHKKVLNNTEVKEVSLNDLIPRLTLNIICETALGVQLDDRLDGDEYRENITKVEESFVKRAINPLLFSDTMYNLFGDGRKDFEYLKKLHAFSSGIIEKRRALFEEIFQSKNGNASIADDDFELVYKKQRYAMLDTMLRAEKDGLINHEGICEEVDTFMFEGFDTTSMNLIFALMNLALYPEMQERCFDEIQQNIDELTTLKLAALNNLKYLECFIKETQRLYPSVPLILRECTQDTPLDNNLLLPKGAQVAVHIIDIHSNPKYWDKPEEFQPERFLTDNVTAQRHPFAFIPFSAGQRNCIGQKFAMLEMKTLLVYMLKNFKLLPVTDPKDFRFLAGILIRAQSDVRIKIIRRGINK